MKIRKRKVFVLTLAVLLACIGTTALAAGTGDVAGAIESLE